MDQKTTGIVTYLTLIGFVIVLLSNNEKTEYTRFHIRQMTGLSIMGLMSVIPFLGWVIVLLAIVLWVIAVLGAMNGEKREVPLVGKYFQEWFKTM